MNKEEFKASHFDSIGELLEAIKLWIKYDYDYGTGQDDFNRFFDYGAMEEMYYYIKNLQQENKQLKEQNEKEFADYTKFKQEQYNEYLEKTNKLIIEKQQLKKEIEHLETKLLAVQQQFDMAVSLENKKQHIIDELEKWLEDEIKHYKEHFEFVCKNNSLVPSDDTRIILEKDDLIIQKLESTLIKLQELKGSDKE